MNTLLLLTVLLSPTFSSAVPVPDAALRVEAVLPVCAPPLFGDWVVFNDCLMVGNQSAPRDVLVLAGVSLHLAGGAALDIDFAQRKLVIGLGARVVIGLGGRIY